MSTFIRRNSMKRYRSFGTGAGMAVPAFFLLTLLSASPVFSAGSDLVLKGSTTVLPIAQVAAEEFMNRNPGVIISVQGGGSGMGIASLLDGTTDIAASSRRIKEAEIEKAKASGIKPCEIVIAMDGIAVIVHPSNPVNRLSRERIRDIYTGKISDWSELGGKRSKIIVISRDTSSGTFEAFEELALNREKVRPDALTAASNQAVAQIVAQTPGALGYISLGYLSTKVKAVDVNEVKCTKQNIISGTYVLSRPLFMYTNGTPAGEVRKLIDYILSPEVQELVEEEGFIGLK